MVKFTNITYDEEFIYATAEDLDRKETGIVKLHRTKELFEFKNNKYTPSMHKALWELQIELKKSGSLPEEYTVCWG